MKKYIIFAISILLFICLSQFQYIPSSFAAGPAPPPVCNPPQGTTVYTAGLGQQCNYQSSNYCSYQIQCKKNAGLSCNTTVRPEVCVSSTAKVIQCTCGSNGGKGFTCKGQGFSCGANLICLNSSGSIVPNSIVGKSFPQAQYTVKGITCQQPQQNGTAKCQCTNPSTNPNISGGGKNGFKCTDTNGKAIGGGYCGSVHDECQNAPGQVINGSYINISNSPTGKTLGTGYNVTGISCHQPNVQCKCTSNSSAGNGENSFTCTNPDSNASQQLGGGFCKGAQSQCQDAPGFSVDTQMTSNYSGFLAANGGYQLVGIKCNLLAVAPTLPPPPSPPCQQWNNGQCTSFLSVFGNIPTNPSGFIKTLFDVLLSISGGIALLLIIKAGYQLMTSQGKPEQLNSGRDQLIAAIVGLVFLIFSFVILQLIGFDILHIPGFGP